MKRVYRRLAIIQKLAHRRVIEKIMAGEQCSREGAEQRHKVMSVEQRLRLAPHAEQDRAR